jgi:hypothetical protein
MSAVLSHANPNAATTPASGHHRHTRLATGDYSMIIIHFKGGYQAAVPGATQVVRVPSGAGAGPFNFQCTDAAGHERGRFTEHKMLGYVIVPEEEVSSHEGAPQQRKSYE